MKNFILQNSERVKKAITPGYPFNMDELYRNAENIDWELLSANQVTDFSIEFCIDYEERINWEKFNPFGTMYFHGEGAGERTTRFLKRFANQINWQKISPMLGCFENQEVILSMFEERWDWSGICRNFRINWTMDLLRRFRHRIDWTELSGHALVHWEYAWLEEFEDELDWARFYYYGGYNWDQKSIIRFRRQLEGIGEEVDRLLSGVDSGKLANRNMERTQVRAEEEMLRMYHGFYHTLHGITDVVKLVESYPDAISRINFVDDLKWTEESFAYVLDLKGSDVVHLSTTSGFEDVVEVLRKFKDRLIWGGRHEIAGCSDEGKEEIQNVTYGISVNETICWTEEMLDEFREYIHWDLLSEYGVIMWTPGIVHKYMHLMNKDVVFEDDSFMLDILMDNLDEKMVDMVFWLHWN